MIELNQLKYFITIVEQKTISKAAEVLLISQPALSRSLQNLENTLSVKLFDRSKNSIQLNENGKFVYPYAKELLKLAEKLKTDVSAFELMSQIISIGTLAPMPLRVLNGILKDHDNNLKIKTQMDNLDKNLIIGLKNNLYNIIILNEPYKHKDYTSIKLFEEKLFITFPFSHPKASLENISFNQLDGESVLLFSDIGVWNDVCLEHIPNSHLLTQTDVAIFNKIKETSSLPFFKTDISMLLEKEDNRAHIPIVDDAAKMTFYAVYHKNNKDRFNFIEKNMLNFNWKKTNF